MLIKNVDIITPYEVLKGYGVLVENGQIVDIDLEEKFRIGEYEIIDGDGNYLSPGFIDIHNHGNKGFDIMDSSEEALDEIGKYHISNGVTSYLGTVITSSYDNIMNAIENINNYKNKHNISRIIGVHLEGPFFDLGKKGAQPEEHIKTPDLDKIKSIVDIAKDKMKMVSIAPELEGALDIIKYLKARNITIAMAHTNATFEETKKGIACGVTVATHLYNGMRTFNHREPGVIGASLEDDRVYCEIIYDRIHLHDGAVNIALKMKGYDKIVLVSDAMRAAGLEDGEYELGEQKVNVSKGAARLESGSLAGSTLNMQKAVYNMVNFLNIPIYEAIKMASLNAAKTVKLDDKLGSIEIGKRADLIIFDRDINIKNVILDGKLVI
ncbi:N-acetylglucosamine-6-phosphate deacetylase [Tissierella pigra]|uniref:N-acetylglucosamine-6-phosphate deacetylase n=1 Tax=Tissierella pigra TaxID=2607614 RepID=A0A6N7Y198_9FIRM|nr:N-acetylglucosamine-6-phosphate deacetylase [Tissierella pigra]MSU01770.1 N-acetylglucosamine-6-phosphate deacetylase [Tissierella pigra]